MLIKMQLHLLKNALPQRLLHHRTFALIIECSLSFTRLDPDTSHKIPYE